MDALKSPSNSDIDLVRLAREIAMDILPLETILKQYSISDETWSQLQRSTRFRRLLASEVELWQTALNTHERVKMKSASMLEEWLPELNCRMHDPEEALPAKIEAGKMLARIAGLGMPTDVQGNIGERFQINISMGEIRTEISKDVVVQPKVIDIEPNEVKTAEKPTQNGPGRSPLWGDEITRQAGWSNKK